MSVKTLSRASYLLALLLIVSFLLFGLDLSPASARPVPTRVPVVDPLQTQAGKLMLVFPAGTQTSGGGVVFNLPYSEVPVLNLSVSSQGGSRALDSAGTPTFDYMPTEAGFSVVAHLDYEPVADAVFTVDWRASYASQ